MFRRKGCPVDFQRAFNKTMGVHPLSDNGHKNTVFAALSGINGKLPDDFIFIPAQQRSSGYLYNIFNGDLFHKLYFLSHKKDKYKQNHLYLSSPYGMPQVSNVISYSNLAFVSSFSFFRFFVRFYASSNFSTETSFTQMTNSSMASFNSSRDGIVGAIRMLESFGSFP